MTRHAAVAERSWRRKHGIGTSSVLAPTARSPGHRSVRTLRSSRDAAHRLFGARFEQSEPQPGTGAPQHIRTSLVATGFTW